MAANNLNIGIGVVDQTQAGISSVVNRLSRAIPANLAVQIEAVLGKNWQQALSTAEKDVNKLDELLNKFNTTTSRGKTTNTFKPLYEDAMKAETAVNLLQRRLDEIKQKSGYGSGFGNLSTVREVKGLINDLNNAASPSALATALSKFKIMGNEMLNGVLSRATKNPELANAISNYQKIFDKLQTSLNGKNGKRLTNQFAEINKELMAASRTVATLSAKSGMKNPIAGMQAYANEIQKVIGQIRNLDSEIAKNNRLLSRADARRANSELYIQRRQAYSALDAARQSGSAYWEVGRSGVQGFLDSGTQRAAMSSATAMRNNLLEAQQEAHRYGQRIDEVTSKMSRQSSIVSDLRNQLIGLYGVTQIGSFLKNIVDIGGQFEYQRMSIGHILGDMGKANVLFNQLKTLALSSPFNTIELDQASKMLSAFNIEYNELYTTLKQIGDISAATGTEINRLVYAFGHVKSQGFMNAMQARMFTNANVPIIPELSKLYSEREGRQITREDIYKRMKSRDVEAADVKEVFNRLAGPGGKFSNMQEVMGNTVKGVWKNLGDAINHMYMDIEKSNDTILRDLGKSLTGIVKNVNSMLPFIEAAVGVWGAWKLASFSLTMMQGKEAITTLRAMTAINDKEAAMLRQVMTYRKLTADEAEYLTLTQAVSAVQIKQAMTAGKLTEAQLYQAVTAGKLNAIQIAHLVTMKKITIEGVRNALMMKTFTGQFNLLLSRSAKFSAFWSAFLHPVNTVRAGAIGIGNAFKTTWATIKTGAASSIQWLKGLSLSSIKSGAISGVVSGATKIGTVFNRSLGFIINGARLAAGAIKSMIASFGPMLAVMAAVEGFMAIRRRKEEREQGLQNYRQTTEENLNSIKEITVQYKAEFAGMSADDLKSAREELTNAIKNELASSSSILEEVYKRDANGGYLHTTAEQCEMMYGALSKVNKELEKADLGGAIQYAAERTTSQFSHNLDGNLKELAKLERTADTKIKTLDRSDLKELQDFVNEIGKGDKEFEKLNGKLIDQITYLALIGKVGKKSFEDITAGNGGDLERYVDRLGGVAYQINNFNDKVGESVKKLSPDSFVQSVFTWMTSSLGIENGEFAKKLANIWGNLRFGEPVKIPVEPEIKDKKRRKAAWMLELEKQLKGANFSAEIRASADINSAIEACKKIYDEALKKWNNLTANSNAFGIKLNFGLAFSNPEQMKEMIRLQLKMARQTHHNAAPGSAEAKQAGAQIDYLKDLMALVDDVSGKKFFDALDDANKKDKKGSSSDKSKDIRDKALEALRKEEKQVNDVVAAYEDLLKTMTKIDAVEKMRGNPLWMDAFKKFFPNGEIDEANMARAYRELAQKVPGLDKPKDYGKMTDDEKREYEENRKAFITDLNRRAEQEENKEAQRAMQDAIRNIDIYMNKQKQMYDLYEKMYAATGDAGLAGLFAFGKEGEGFTDKLEKFKSDFKKEFNAKFGDKYSLDKLMGMSEEELNNLHLPTPIQNMLDSFKKELEAMSNEKKKFLVDLYKGFNDTYTKIQQIDAEFAENKNKLDSIEWLKNNKELYDRMLSLLTSRTETKKLELTAKYISYFDDGLKSVDRDIQQIGKDIKSNLIDQFASGNIVFSEFVNKLKDAGNILLDNRLAQDGTLGRLSGRITRQDIAQNNINQAYDGIRRVLYEVTSSAEYDSLSKNDKLELVSGIIEKDGKKLEKFGNIVSKESKEILKSSKDLLESGENAIMAMQRLSDISNIVKGASGMTKSSSILSSSILGKSGRHITNSMNIASSAMDGAANTLEASSQGATQAIQAAFEGVANLSQTISAVTQDDYEQEVAEKKQELEAIKRAYEDITYEQNKIGGKSNLGYQIDAIKNIEEQRDKVQEMLKQDTDRTASWEDPAVQAEYENQIYELERKMQDSWRDFWSGFGLDLKSFSSQLTDALTSAWEKGEDAALAWNKTVGNVLKDFAKNWYNAKMMEQFLKPLDDALFGEGGMMTTGNQEDFDKGLKYMKDYLQYGNAQKFINDLKNGYDVLEQMFPDSFKEGGTSGITASEKALTESTGNILASYVDAIRLYSSEGNVIAQSQLDTLNRIDGNVMYIAGKMDAVENAMTRAQDYWDAVSMGTKRVAIQ